MSDRKIIPMNINGKVVMIEVENIDVITPIQAHEMKDLRGSAQPTSALAGDKIINHIVEVADALEAVVGSVEQGMQNLRPGEWSVELNMGFTVEGNVFIAKGAVNSGFKVTAKWVNKDG
jgi:hypothetical protein